MIFHFLLTGKGVSRVSGRRREVGCGLDERMLIDKQNRSPLEGKRDKETVRSRRNVTSEECTIPKRNGIH